LACELALCVFTYSSTAVTAHPGWTWPSFIPTPSAVHGLFVPWTIRTLDLASRYESSSDGTSSPWYEQSTVRTVQGTKSPGLASVLLYSSIRTQHHHQAVTQHYSEPAVHHCQAGPMAKC